MYIKELQFEPQHRSSCGLTDIPTVKITGHLDAREVKLLQNYLGSNVPLFFDFDGADELIEEGKRECAAQIVRRNERQEKEALYKKAMFL